MTPEKSEAVGTYVMAAQVVISFLLMAVSSLANGLLLFLLARFKTLQTTSNILVVDLAAVDLLNVLINVPLFMCYAVLDLNAFRGRITAWLVSSLHVLFAYLTLTTMFFMMIYRFLAIRFPVFYQAAKTKRRLLIAIFVKWLLSFIAVFCVYAFLYKIDLGNSSVLEYRATYNKESNAIIPRILAPPILLASVSMYLVSWKTLKSSHLRANLDRAQNTAGEKRKQKAINTLLIIITIFCVSYLPEIIRSTRGPLGLSSSARQWLLFVMNFILFLPSTVNPFIYFVRVESFRRAFRWLFARTRTDHTDIRESRVRGIALRRERMLSPSGNIIQKSANVTPPISPNQSTAETSSGQKSPDEIETKL